MKNPVRSRKLFAQALEDRTTPSTYLWTGDVSSTWTDYHNWSGGVPTGTPGFSDVAEFPYIVTGKAAPTLASGVSKTIGKFQMDAGCNYTVTIDGTLTARQSDTAAGVFGGKTAGAGTINLVTVTDAAEGVGHVLRAPMDVRVLNVYDHAQVDLYAAELGPQGPSPDGSFNIGTISEGLVWLKGPSGSSVSMGWSEVRVDGSGHLWVNTATTWANTGSGFPSGANLFGLYNSGVIDASHSLTLNGGYFNQSAGTLNVTEFRSLALGDNASYADGSRDFTDNVNVNGGTVNMYTGSGISTVNGDMLFSGSAFNIRTPGLYDSGTQGVVNLNAGYQGSGTSTMTFTGGSGAHQTIAFLNDAYGTVQQQAGAKLYSTVGKIVLAGNTDVSIRQDFNGIGKNYDYIQGLKVNMDGTALTLGIACTNAPPHGMKIMYDVVLAATGQLTKTNNSGWAFNQVGVSGMNPTVYQSDNGTSDTISLSW